MKHFKILFCLFACFVFTCCASRKARLEAEYNRVSAQESALKEEMKKMVNLENAIQDAVQIRSTLEKHYKALEKVRDENYTNGQPLGPTPPGIDYSYGDQLRQIKKNYEEISDQIDKLTEEKKRIVEEQYD